MPSPSSNSLEAQVLQNWAASRWTDMTLMVAVSGGADSVALLRALVRLRSSTTRILVGHYNHRLRGSESDDDALFVERLCQKHSLPFVSNECSSNGTASIDERFDLSGSRKAPSDEASLRSIRYRFLEEQASKHGARYLVTAHTANDQAETVLFRILRGTGLTGIAGIPSFRSSFQNPDLILARPLLSVTRQEIENYLEMLGQDYRIDSSNQSSDYSRNWIRNELIPNIESRMGPQTLQSVIHLSHSAQDYQKFLDETSEPWDSKVELLIESDHCQIRVDQSLLFHTHWHVMQHLIRRRMEQATWPMGNWNRNSWEELRNFFEFIKTESIGKPIQWQQTMRKMLPGGIQVKYERLSLWLTPTPFHTASPSDDC